MYFSLILICAISSLNNLVVTFCGQPVYKNAYIINKASNYCLKAYSGTVFNQRGIKEQK